MSSALQDTTTFDVGPLRDALAAGGGPGTVLRDAEHAGRIGERDRVRLRRALHRAYRSGRINLAHADEICVLVLGRHPRNLWPDDW